MTLLLRPLQWLAFEPSIAGNAPTTPPAATTAQTPTPATPQAEIIVFIIPFAPRMLPFGPSRVGPALHKKQVHQEAQQVTPQLSSLAGAHR